MHHNKIFEKKIIVLVAQSSPALCDPMDCSLPGSSVQGILQARILVWVAMPWISESSQPRDQTRVSCPADKFFTTEPPGKFIPLYLRAEEPTVVKIRENKSKIIIVHLLSAGCYE